MSQAIPITLLTGFLGSGKTTLLAKLLAHPRLRDTAVLVNELGEIGLDHQLLYSGAEAIVSMDRGCLCCALRSDLADQLDDLYTRRMRKEIAPFARVVIETTGLADPAPILQTLAVERTIAALYRLDGVITTVDAQLGERELDEHFESVKQAAVADRLVITKVDLVDPESIARLALRLRSLNPAARIEHTARGELDPGVIIDLDGEAHAVRGAQVMRWLAADRYRPAAGFGSALPLAARGSHDPRIRSFALVYDRPVSGNSLWAGLERLIDEDGDKLLRVKGIVNVIGQERPRVIHIVQHVLYPVATLAAWPDADKRTRLVFIVRDLDPAAVQATLTHALAQPV